MECSGGQKSVMRAVNSSKARSGASGTLIVRRTSMLVLGSTVT
jgi:hypothetical protein